MAQVGGPRGPARAPAGRRGGAGPDRRDHGRDEVGVLRPVARAAARAGDPRAQACAASSPTCARRRCSARDRRDFTVPLRQPSAAAVSASESSSEVAAGDDLAVAARRRRRAPRAARRRARRAPARRPQGRRRAAARATRPARGRADARPARRPAARAGGCAPRWRRSPAARAGTGAPRRGSGRAAPSACRNAVLRGLLGVGGRRPQSTRAVRKAIVLDGGARAVRRRRRLPRAVRGRGGRSRSGVAGSPPLALHLRAA